MEGLGELGRSLLERGKIETIERLLSKHCEATGSNGEDAGNT